MRRAGCSMPSDRPRLVTKNGRDFYEVASLLQKSLRRGDIVMCSRAVNELLPKYANYCWNRLMTVSAEDCADMVTGEIVALYDAWLKVNHSSRDNSKGRMFFAKAIVILARAPALTRRRRAEPPRRRPTPRRRVRRGGRCVRPRRRPTTTWEIPSYVYDVHTRRGKRMGKTKAQFIREERDALANPTTLFANLDEMIESADVRRAAAVGAGWGYR